MLIRKRMPSGLKQLIAPRTQSLSIFRAMRMTLSMKSGIRKERPWEIYGIRKVFICLLYNLIYYLIQRSFTNHFE